MKEPGANHNRTHERFPKVMGNSLKLKSWQGELVLQLNYGRAVGKAGLRSALLFWVACGIGAVAGWPSRSSYWGRFPETASCPPRTLNRAQSPHYKTCFCLAKWDTSVGFANSNTSHVLVKKCCSVLGAQGVPSVPGFLERVGSWSHMSSSQFLSTSPVLADFNRVLWLVVCHS